MHRKTIDPACDIAVVSTAGRFPSAPSCDALWQAVQDGTELISTYDKPFAGEQHEGMTPIPRGAFLHAPEYFDYAFFCYTPREAARMDPQQRQSLEVCYQAMQAAGYARASDAGVCGVFVGTRPSTWHEHAACYNDHNPFDAMLSVGGRSSDSVATRIAYKLDCSGPALNLANFCSGSLLAVHLACRSLKAGECDFALAGGACIRYPAHTGYLYHEGGILSRQGRVRAFDRRADGTVFADAVAFAGLRRLEDALKDGNPILALIRGSAVNNDGAGKAGYSAPSAAAQEFVIRQALQSAGMQPHQLGMIEAHGTGTPIGDGIELRALTRVFEEVPPSQCALGSVKSTMGHADCASGITGFIKAVYAVHRGILPMTMNCEQPCHELLAEGLPFFISNQSGLWSSGDRPRAAGISSFGIGGTNVHVVISQAPPVTSQPTCETVHLIPLSARNQASLHEQSKAMLQYVRQNPEQNLADFAFTLQCGRQHWPMRRILIVDQTAQLEEGLRWPEKLFLARNISCSEDIVAFAWNWLDGQASDWSRFYAGERRHRLMLPAYPLMSVPV